MRKLTLFCNVLLFFNLNAQPLLQDDFLYTGNLVDNGWIAVDVSVTGNPVPTFSPGLTFPNYPLNRGNAAKLLGQSSSQDVYKKIPAQQKLYYSFLINIEKNTFTRTGIVAFLGKTQALGPNGTLNGNYFARVIIKTKDGKWQIGASNWSLANVNNPPQYGMSYYSFDKTYVVIVSFDYTNDKTMKLWIKEDYFPSSESEAGNPDVIFVGAATIPALPTVVDAVALRQENDIPNCLIDGVMVFNTWDALILPLKLISFSGTAEGNYKKIQWVTVSEENVSHFEVEKSMDSKIFDKIGFVFCHNQNGQQYYTHLDKINTSVDAYYRLKIVDNDYSHKYSPIIFLEGVTNEILKISSLGNKKINIKIPNTTSYQYLKIIGMDGVQQTLIKLNALQTDYQIYLQNAPVGSYVLCLEGATRKTTQKFILY